MSEFRFCSLGSGSGGNCTIVQSPETTLLIDCGFPLYELQNRLERRSIDPESIEAILVTHEHADHHRGIKPFIRKYDVMVLMSKGTEGKLNLPVQSNVTRLMDQSEYCLNDLHILPVGVPHDTVEPLQYVIKFNDLAFGILTDVGSITPSIRRAYAACSSLLIEFNHDIDSLWQGPYRQFLKERVAGPLGHLNNGQALEFLESILHKSLADVVIGHISKINNSREQVLDQVEHLRANTNIHLASQEFGTEWITIGAAA